MAPTAEPSSQPARYDDGSCLISAVCTKLA